MNKVLISLLFAAIPHFTVFAADAPKPTDATKQADVAAKVQKASATKAAEQSVKININTASEAELTQLKGIGNAKAKAIVEYRNQYGQFATIEDITKVSGIGAKVLEDNRHLLTL